eukprot:428582-Hanusia_phi.AAC.1
MRAAVAVCAGVALTMAVAVLMATGGRGSGGYADSLRVALAGVEGEEGKAAGAEGSEETRGLGWYERIMQAVMNFDGNATECDELGAMCAIGLKNKKDPEELTSQMAEDWMADQPWDAVPYQFCSALPQLDEKELEACLTHFLKPLDIMRGEKRGNSSASNSSAMITDDPRWLQCYRASTSRE